VSEELKKVLVMPPIKGLNLYDNPLQMDPEFATVLDNFIPPSTELRVRPGVQELSAINLTVMGMFAYSFGGSTQYGTHWYDRTIKYAAADLMLVKGINGDAQAKLFVWNPNSGEWDGGVDMAYCDYSADIGYFSHSAFFMSGAANNIAYTYSSVYGLKPLQWRNTNTGNSIKVADLTNLVMFKGWGLASPVDSQNWYYMPAIRLDPDGTGELSPWDSVWQWFQPVYLSQATINGVAHWGGKIVRMFTMSKQSNNFQQQFLCILTDQGELILYDCEDKLDGSGNPTDTKFVVQGHFYCPPPLNIRCICEVEGDMVIMTRQGLVSLRKIIGGTGRFDQTAFEYRLNKLFDDYMFHMSPFSDYFFITYYPKKRWIIVNIPTQMTLALPEWRVGYQLERSITILKNNMHSYNLNYSDLLSYVISYILLRQVDYTITIYFNNSNDQYIELDFDTIQPDATDKLKTQTTITGQFNYIDNDSTPQTIDLYGGQIICEDINIPSEENTSISGGFTYYNTAIDLESLHIQDETLEVSEIAYVKSDWNYRTLTATAFYIPDTLLPAPDSRINYHMSISTLNPDPAMLTSIHEAATDFTLDDQTDGKLTTIYNLDGLSHNPTISEDGTADWGDCLLQLCPTYYEDDTMSVKGMSEKAREHISGHRYPLANYTNPTSFPVFMEGWKMIGALEALLLYQSISSTVYGIAMYADELPQTGDYQEVYDMDLSSPDGNTVYTLRIIMRYENIYFDIYLTTPQEDRQVTFSRSYEIYLIKNTDSEVVTLLDATTPTVHIKMPYAHAYDHPSDAGGGKLIACDSIKMGCISSVDYNLAPLNINVANTIGDMGVDLYNYTVTRISRDSNTSYPTYSMYYNPVWAQQYYIFHIMDGMASGYSGLEALQHINSIRPEITTTTPLNADPLGNAYFSTWDSSGSHYVYSPSHYEFKSTDSQLMETYQKNVWIDQGGWLLGLVGLNVQGGPIPFADSATMNAASVPLIRDLTALNPFKSKQYVMDIRWNTWSSWSGIDMQAAVSFDNEFYFSRTYGGKQTQAPQGSTTRICKFNEDFLTDFEDNKYQQSAPIVATFQGGATDLGTPYSKKFKNISVLTNAATITHILPSEEDVLPEELCFNITGEVDFVPQDPLVLSPANHHIDYPDPPPSRLYDAFKKAGLLTQQILNLHSQFGEVLTRENNKLANVLPLLSYTQKKAYKRAVLDILEQPLMFNLPITFKPGSRISVGSVMHIESAAARIYGFDIYFEELKGVI